MQAHRGSFRHLDPRRSGRATAGVALLAIALTGMTAGGAPAAVAATSTSAAASDAARIDALGQTELLPPAPADNGNFGGSVAIDGDTAVVGERFAGGILGGTGGRAWVYVKQGSAWVLQAELISSSTGPFDDFGLAVAIDGDTIVVGAPDALDLEGTATVFVRTGTVWTEQAVLSTDDGLDGRDYGFAVDIDGDTIVVGARNVGTHGQPYRNGGAAYVYKRAGAAWALQKRLQSDNGVWDHFGSEVAIDGSTIAVAAPDDSSPGESKDGALYVFVRSGSTWTRQATIVGGPEIYGLGADLDLDGNTIVAGSSNSISEAYVYVRSGTRWTLQAELRAADPESNLNGGLAVEGNILLAGDYYGHSSGCEFCGLVYVFTRTGSVWTQKKVIAPVDGEYDSGYGGAIAYDGVNAIIGASRTEGPGGELEDAGAAYIVER